MSRKTQCLDNCNALAIKNEPSIPKSSSSSIS